jgi:hypothetical protein
MGKDRRSDRQRCLRCTKWAEHESELCSDCEQNVLDDMRDDATDNWDFHSGVPPEVLRATHGPPVFGPWKSTFTFVKDAVIGRDYLDALDQERADSLEGGE